MRTQPRLCTVRYYHLLLLVAYLKTMNSRKVYCLSVFFYFQNVESQWMDEARVPVNMAKSKDSGDNNEEFSSFIFHPS